MESKHKTIMLLVPEYIKPYRKNKKEVGVDVGIVETIKHLWKNKIITLNSCQGMVGYMDGRPTIIIPELYKADDIKMIKKLIAEIDDRNVALLQWNLIEI